MKPETTVFQGGGRVIAIGLVAFALGTIVLVVGGMPSPRAAFFAYLSAYAFVLSIVLGALIFLMTCNAMNATWPVAVRRVIEAVVGVLPLMAVGFLPLIPGMRFLYPWMRPETITDHETREAIAHKAPYLNAPSFVVRAFVYFVIWIGVAYMLRRWSLRADRNASLDRKERARILSSVGLPPVSLALTFASFDWIMSLEPTWYSTMFGIYWFAGGILAALGLIVLLVAGAQREGMLARVTSNHYYALGRLLLTFTIFWAYAAFFQFFLIWIANKPEETRWFVVRGVGTWASYSAVLAVTHFVLPFFVLLPYQLKRRPAMLAPIAGWLVVVHWLDMEWLVMPELRPAGPTLHWMDVAGLLCVGGAALAYGTYRLRGESIFPKNDPAIEAAFKYESI
jgi:hypothetical protein